MADSDGALFLDEHSRTFGSHRIIGQGDIAGMEQYRSDSANWQVRREPELIGVAEGPFTIGSGPTVITVPIQWPSDK